MKKIDYKGLTGLLLENTVYSIVILPDLGGKVASLYHKPTEFELLYQNPADSYVIPEKYGRFDAYDCSGIDDCWPNIDAGIGHYGGIKINYPDHGDVWFRPCDYQLIGTSLECAYVSDLMPFIYEKTFTLTNDGLAIDYHIVNTGDYPIEGFYTFHGLMNCEEDMTFIFPDSVNEILNVVDPSTVLGATKSIHSFPVTKDLSGNDYRLDKTAGASAHKCEKYYSTQAVTQGKCGAYYSSINQYFVMTYDHKKLPYFGLWLNESRDNGPFNYALEPSNGYYDAIEIAKSHGKCPEIAPGDSLDFTLNLSICHSY